MWQLVQFHGKQSMMGKNEKRAPINTAKHDVDRALWYIDLADQFPRCVEDKYLPVGYVHVASAIHCNALAAALRKGFSSPSVPSALTNAL